MKNNISMKNNKSVNMVKTSMKNDPCMKNSTSIRNGSKSQCYTSMVFLNMIILLNILRAGPSFIFRIFTISDCVNNKKASPSIC